LFSILLENAKRPNKCVTVYLLSRIFLQINKSTNQQITLVFYPTYFSPIIQYVALAKADGITFEVEDNFQKQTYRTRCYIYSPNGKQLLSIPIKNANSSQKTKDVLIDTSFNWQKQHLKSIEAAYRSSPFYEFFEDEIQLVFKKTPKFLLDFNFICQDLVFELLQFDKNYTSTTFFQKTPELKDLRYLANAKSDIDYKLDPYTQVFSEKHGFIENLCILDLLFMEGSNALSYLESQKIDF